MLHRRLHKSSRQFRRTFVLSTCGRSCTCAQPTRDWLVLQDILVAYIQNSCAHLSCFAKSWELAPHAMNVCLDAFTLEATITISVALLFRPRLNLNTWTFPTQLARLHWVTSSFVCKSKLCLWANDWIAAMSFCFSSFQEFSKMARSFSTIYLPSASKARNCFSTSPLMHYLLNPRKSYNPSWVPQSPQIIVLLSLRLRAGYPIIFSPQLGHGVPSFGWFILFTFREQGSQWLFVMDCCASENHFQFAMQHLQFFFESWRVEFTQCRNPQHEFFNVFHCFLVRFVSHTFR